MNPCRRVSDREHENDDGPGWFLLGALILSSCGVSVAYVLWRGLQVIAGWLS